MRNNRDSSTTTMASQRLRVTLVKAVEYGHQLWKRHRTRPASCVFVPPDAFNALLDSEPSAGSVNSTDPPMLVKPSATSSRVGSIS